MKKKIFTIVLVAIIAITAGWNFNQSKNEVALSDLALANVDALARDETTCTICYGFEMKEYSSGCKICKDTGYGPCDIRDQVPC